ncbi:MAG: hypothetical protein IJG68_01835 [Bacilli bacterium]|nr:hypothetical protein [Bacilli bacterium]
MILNDLEKLVKEAKEHCVPGNTKVNVYKTDPYSIKRPDKLTGILYDVDYDNNGLNLYYEEL